MKLAWSITLLLFSVMSFGGLQLVIQKVKKRANEYFAINLNRFFDLMFSVVILHFLNK